jgi:hypothetical protein
MQLPTSPPEIQAGGLDLRVADYASTGCDSKRAPDGGSWLAAELASQHSFCDELVSFDGSPLDKALPCMRIAPPSYSVLGVGGPKPPGDSCDKFGNAYSSGS